jgi:hypothetical protein
MKLAHPIYPTLVHSLVHSDTHKRYDNHADHGDEYRKTYNNLHHQLYQYQSANYFAKGTNVRVQQNQSYDHKGRTSVGI